MKTLALIEQELKKTYPTRIVSDLKRTNEDLYIKLREYSKEHNTSIKNLLEERDYIYLRKSIIRLYVDDFIELEKAFPDYKISGFYESNNKLYYRILAHAKSLKVSLKKYLNSLGFEYEAREELSNDTTKEELIKLYPNKIVKGLSAKDNKLYYRVYQQAKKENLPLNDYLVKIGFSVDSSRNKDINKDKKEVSSAVKTKKVEENKENKIESKSKTTRSKKDNKTLEKVETKKRGRKPSTEKTQNNENKDKPKTVKTAKNSSKRKTTVKNTTKKSQNKATQMNKESEKKENE